MWKQVQLVDGSLHIMHIWLSAGWQRRLHSNLTSDFNQLNDNSIYCSADRTNPSKDIIKHNYTDLNNIDCPTNITDIPTTWISYYNEYKNYKYINRC
jgi:hypothetical protein